MPPSIIFQIKNFCKIRCLTIVLFGILYNKTIVFGLHNPYNNAF